MEDFEFGLVDANIRVAPGFLILAVQLIVKLHLQRLNIGCNGLLVGTDQKPQNRLFANWVIKDRVLESFHLG